MVIKTEIKILLEKEGKSQSKLAEELGFKTPQAFNRKLCSGAYRVDEFDNLLNYIGYELKIVKKGE